MHGFKLDEILVESHWESAWGGSGKEKRSMCGGGKRGMINFCIIIDVLLSFTFLEEIPFRLRNPNHPPGTENRLFPTANSVPSSMSQS